MRTFNMYSFVVGTSLGKKVPGICEIDGGSVFVYTAGRSGKQAVNKIES